MLDLFFSNCGFFSGAACDASIGRIYDLFLVCVFVIGSFIFSFHMVCLVCFYFFRGQSCAALCLCWSVPTSFNLFLCVWFDYVFVLGVLVYFCKKHPVYFCV